MNHPTPERSSGPGSTTHTALPRRAWAAAVVLLLSAALAHGAPPRPEFLTTPAGREKARRIEERTPRPAVRPVSRTAARGTMGRVSAATGTIVPLVLLVDFPDVPRHPFSGSDVPAFADHLFWNDGGWNYGGPNSVREYFLEVSYNALDVRGDSAGDGVVDGVKDWRTLPGTLSSYNSLAGFPALVADAVAAHEGAGVDFSRYDQNLDGVVDALIVVHAGFGSEDTNNQADIPSHYATLPSSIVVDGVAVSDYILVPEQSILSGAHLAEIGVYCHEIGHLLGLPELYDTTFQGFGVGTFDLMGYGLWGPAPASPFSVPNQPTHLSAWSKAKLGWLTPAPVWSDAAGVPLYRVEDHPEALKIYASSSGKEYFLVEHRQSYNFDYGWSGYDTVPPYYYAAFSWEEGGLVIWHVDENVLEAAGSTPNNNPFMKGVDVECANDPDGGLDDLDDIVEPLTATSFAKTAHFYLGTAAFGAAGRPPSTTNGGAATGILVTNGLSYNARSSGVTPLPVQVTAGTVVLDPRNLLAAAVGGAIEVTWSPSLSGDVAAYRIYVDAAPAPFLELPSSAATALLEGFDPCVAHTILLSAVDADANESTGLTAAVEGAPSYDADGDGYTTPGSCAGSRDDCDDLDAAIHPGAAELCDGLDNDCDAVIDEGACGSGGGGGGGCFLDVLRR